MKKYYITLLYPSLEVESDFQTDSPKTALNKWLTYSCKRPTMANISCGSKEDCMELYKEFLCNKEEFFNKYWMRGRGLPIRFDYFVNTCDSYVNGKKKLYFSGNSRFYDSVYPFCLG